jgi:hypothetical protein
MLPCLLVLAFLGFAAGARAQTPSSGPSVEVYGFGQADAIVDFKTTDPNWGDVLRPSRLPSFPGQFGEDGHFYLMAKQSRLGVRGLLPTTNGDVKAQFEFDMYGTGKDAGITTIRLRHAWGQWKQIGGGQTNTAFMDVDVFPNTVEYWGPNGMLFLRNAQVFWEPIAEPDGTNARIAIEAPGASGDAGVLSDRIELQNIRPRFPSPDLTGHYRFGRKQGYLQVGAALRYIGYDDALTTDQFDLSGHTWGYGLALSSSFKVTPHDTVRAMGVFGQGIENYFNVAPIDVGLKSNPGNAVTPVTGQALGDIGLLFYLDHNWNERWSTAAGYSRVDIDNSDLQAANAYKNGQYASFNLLCTPAPSVLMGGEFIWGNRDNHSDGYSVSDYRVQFSVKYSFSAKAGG